MDSLLLFDSKDRKAFLLQNFQIKERSQETDDQSIRGRSWYYVMLRKQKETSKK